MLRSYLRIAFRNLRRNLGYTAINLTGLAIGIAACFLIALYVRHELSYDDFHAKADRIYRVVQHEGRGDRTEASLHHAAPLAPALRREFPGVFEAVRISERWGEDLLIEHGGNTFYEDNFFFADSTLFEVFSFPLLQGDPQSALTRPFSVVITERMAQKYFGDVNPIGQMIQVTKYSKTHELEVTGVAKNPPSTSHFQFNFLVPFNTLRQTMSRPQSLDSWFDVLHYTYVLLEERARPDDLEAALPAFYIQQLGRTLDELKEAGGTLAYQLQPITDIHLRSNYERELEANSDIRYVYIFGTLALLILVVACINYMNLATAQATGRAREVGVRKTIGARRPQLIRQFLGESALLCAVALVGALALAGLTLPLFNDLTGLELGGAFFDGPALLLFVGIGVTVAIVAGSYPAFYLSAYQPVQVITGSVQAGPAGSRFRKSLVVFQFAVAVALIASTALIHQQLRHMQTKRLGLNEERVVAIHARDAMHRQYDAFKQELLQQAQVTGVTASNVLLPNTQNFTMSFIPEGVDRDEWLSESDLSFQNLSVDEDFLRVMEIPLVAGRDLTEATRSDEYMPVLINETAARAIGWERPVGKTFQCCFSPTPRVVGVVEDFHFQTLRRRIQPLVITESTYSPQYVMVRLGPGDLPGTLDALQTQWAKVSDAPFEYTFLDRRFDQVYRAERRMASAFQVFAGLAVLIACLGLFGLAAYAAERRTKEIGIRKALGATMANIVALLSKEFVLLVALACVVGAPVAYWAMERWLQDFAYRIDVSPLLFVASSAVAVLIALATISYQAIRAARTNPADALRYE
jgi:putative ABC transport system permease protein